MIELLQREIKAEVEKKLKKLGAARALDFTEYDTQEIVKISQESFKPKKDPATGAQWQKSKKNEDSLVGTADPLRSIYLRATSDDHEGRTDQVYSTLYNQSGKTDKSGRVRLPQRRFLGLDADWGRRFLVMSEVRELLGVGDFAERS